MVDLQWTRGCWLTYKLTVGSVRVHRGQIIRREGPSAIEDLMRLHALHAAEVALGQLAQDWVCELKAVEELVVVYAAVAIRIEEAHQLGHIVVWDGRIQERGQGQNAVLQLGA